MKKFKKINVFLIFIMFFGLIRSSYASDYQTYIKDYKNVYYLEMVYKDLEAANNDIDVFLDEKGLSPISQNIVNEETLIIEVPVNSEDTEIFIDDFKNKFEIENSNIYKTNNKNKEDIVILIVYKVGILNKINKVILVILSFLTLIAMVLLIITTFL